MKKIAIYTIVSNNFGNRLQNYATQETIKRIGYTPITIRRQRYAVYSWIKEFIKLLIGRKSNISFLLFNRKRINWSKEYIDKMNFSKQIENAYDYFLIGSDQIWNPLFSSSTEYDYLPFITKKRKFSFSASFGIEEIPPQYVNMVAKGLNSLDIISVREDAGVAIVQALTEKNAEVLVDPCMMLDAKDWEKIAKKPKKINFEKPYILTYFLGNISSQADNDLKRIKKQYNLHVYSLLKDKELCNVGPCEFLYLIAHATLIMTDSFHACVFSFLFQNPFLVYEREGLRNDMISRIETFLNKFDLQRKFVKNNLANETLECNYKQGMQQLKIERKKVIDFLEQAILDNKK